MASTFTPFDAAEYLDSDEAIAAYINEVIATGDDDLFLSALSDIARARGMSKIADDTGLGRESLYKALKPGAKPGFFTIAKVVAALGVNLRVAVKSTKVKTKNKAVSASSKTAAKAAASKKPAPVSKQASSKRRATA